MDPQVTPAEARTGVADTTVIAAPDDAPSASSHATALQPLSASAANNTSSDSATSSAAVDGVNSAQDVSASAVPASDASASIGAAAAAPSVLAAAPSAAAAASTAAAAAASNSDDSDDDEAPRGKKVPLGPGCSHLHWMRLLSSIPRRPQKKYTLAQVASHTDPARSIWMALRGKVYDVTQYMRFHPGGVPQLLRGAGKDATRLFNDAHHYVNLEQMMNNLEIGVLVEE